VDWIIIVAAIGYAVGGFRNGAVVGLFSVVAVLVNAALGA